MPFRTMMPDLERRYRTGLEATEGGFAAGDEYLRRAREFDATAGAERAAGAQFSRFLPQLRRAIEDLRGSQVGLGRLRTGFGNEDEDRLVGDALQDLNAQVAERAMQSQALNLRALEGIGSYGQSTRGEYFDLLSGGLDRAVAEENERRRRRAGLWGGIAKLAGGALGSFLGPIGSAAGAHLAGKLFPN